MPWSHVLGHDHLIDGFQGVVRRGRLAHAYLFVGREGVGKKLFARELAKALLCEKDRAPRAASAKKPAAVEGNSTDRPMSLEACGLCPACLLVDAGTHPDFFIVNRPEDSLELPIDTMREVCRSFSLKPARGKGKVAVLEDADDLNDAAANCFLKTLEEPPPASTFILIGSSTDRQLPTILSRCQVVRFGGLADELVDRILKQQGVEDKAERERLVKAGRGSPGQALALADKALWDFRRTFLEGFARPRIDVFGLSRALIELVEDAGKEAAAQRRRAAMVLDLLLSAWTDALRLSLGDRGTAGQVDSAEFAALQALAGRAGPERLMDLLERVLAAERQLDLYIQVALVLEGLVEACARILEENPATSLVSSGK